MSLSHQEAKKSDSMAEEATRSPVNRSSISSEAPSDDVGAFSQIHTITLSGKTKIPNQLLSVSCEDEPAAVDLKLSGASHSDDDSGTKASTIHTNEPAAQDWSDKKQKGSQPTIKNKQIKEPLESDIIFGRGKPNHDHPGNRTFRKVVETYQDEYAASRRYDKLAISQEIITGLEAGRWSITPVRFLKRDKESDFWTIASDEETREKVSHALRGKKRPSDSESHKKGKVRKTDEANVTTPEVGNTASFLHLPAANLGTSCQAHLRQRNQYDPLPSQSALSRVHNDGVAEFIRMQSAAAAAATTARPSLSQMLGIGEAQSPSSHLFGTSATILHAPPLMMVNQPSREDLRREIVLRLHAEEAFRQQQEVRAALTSTNTNLLLRSAMMRPIGSQLFSVQEHNVLSHSDQARQEHLLQQVILQRQVLERQQQQQQQHAAIAGLQVSSSEMTRPNEKSEERPPSPPP